MQAGAITSYIDVAQLTLYVFWGFFAALIFYLRREDKREGYPLVSERSEHVRVEGFPGLPAPKTFLLPDGRSVQAPRVEDPQPAFNAAPVALWPGAPMSPIGNPMLSGAGPAAYALRSEEPDRHYEDREPRVQPLRVATDHYMDPVGPDPRGLTVVGADGYAGGVIADVWVDRSEAMVRYLEVTLTGGANVLLPVTMARVDMTEGRILVKSIMSTQFADVPKLSNPDQVSLREEDQIQAYYASGHMYANASRSEPLL
jgi:photosynthetic reaction center H subunit